MIYFPNAKINYGLRILNRREDGYHNLKSAFIPIGWSDVLEVNIDPDITNDNLKFTVKGIEIEGDLENNLVVKAHELLKEDFDLPGLEAVLLKNIPTGAGLGGGSSDGSFMLKAINQLCDLNLTNEQLETYAAKLGSDCPFFIKNRPALVTGRGEILEELECQIQSKEILLIHPGIGVSTSEAFALLTPNPTPLDYSQPSTIINDFQDSVCARVPVVQEALGFLKNHGAEFTQMTGSGSAVYGLFKIGSVNGLELVSKAESIGWKAYFGAFL
ncbi:MAG: 4-(cytidine 5'-diphospho)-2-C-methyl-D-erythritol kinase [Euryarchaeota archaeon]|nr:4-(cytidine 5'-diphospho)-2-C-methyl-D-erythritol kinase [Euryarchaeota archaeon]